MTANEVLKELEGYGDEVIKKIYLNHGVREPLFGVRVQDMKKIVKKIKKDHLLSLELYASGNSDAMYFAGLIADEKQISKRELKIWAKQAPNSGISEYPVPWVASESQYGYELGLEWIESKKEGIASSGWATLGYVASLKSESELDMQMYDQLLERVENNIHKAENRVRYTMNGFVIAVGRYIVKLSDKALKVAQRIGKVSVDMGGTACKVPNATEQIKKVMIKGNVGKKRKTARC